MLDLLNRNRRRFMYARCCMHEQPLILQHSIAAVMEREPGGGLCRHVSLLLAHRITDEACPNEELTPLTRTIKEKLDGSGYPNGLRENQLSDWARAANVVHAVDFIQLGEIESLERPSRFSMRPY